MANPTRSRNAAVRPVGASFVALNATFPLRPIRSAAELAAALGVVEGLMRRELDADEADYLDVLSDLVQKFERAEHPMPDAAESDVLRLLMDGRGLSQNGLAKQSGIAQSTLSAVLDGTRSLTKKQVVTLAALFSVSPVVFLPRPDSVTA